MNTIDKAKAAHKFEALDAFRGLAAVMIVLFHSHFYADTQPNSLVQQSAVFVDFFFVLSGFVMAYSYKDRILNGIGFKKFTLLRFARLYPLHLFTLLVWIPFVGVKFYLYQHGVGENDPARIFNGFTFVQNLLLFQGFSHTTSWNYPSWSISVEFYTYIVFFAVVYFSARLSTLGRLFLFLFVVLAAYVVREYHQGEAFALGSLFRCVSEFFLGVLIYELYKHTSINIANKILATVLEVLVLLLMIYFVTNVGDENGFRHYTIIVFAAVVYLFSIQNSGYVSKLLMTAPFQHLGKISYSVYMTHAIVLAGIYRVLVYLLHLQPGDVSSVPAGVVFEYAFYLNVFFVLVVIGISTLTYKYIEIPGQVHLKRRFDKNDT